MTPTKLPVVMTVAEVRCMFREVFAECFGMVRLPHALGRKYPHAPVEWGWQWVFPQQHRWQTPIQASKNATTLIEPRLKRQ
jgi:hypothetical protein